MANGVVQVAPDSTGKKIQTFENTVGGNVVEAQAIVVVDSTGANTAAVSTVLAKGASTFGQAAIPVWPNAVMRDSYTAVVDGVAIALTAGGGVKHLLSFEHAASATKDVRIRRILIGASVTTASAAVAGQLRLQVWRGTAASTGGTAVTPTAFHPASAAAEVTCKHTPTITAATGPIKSLVTLSTGTAGATVGTAASSNMPFVLYDWQESGETIPLTLRAGNLDTLTISANGTWATTAPTFTWGITVVFTEE
jgi:hypothetical protein